MTNINLNTKLATAAKISPNSQWGGVTLVNQVFANQKKP